MVMDFSLLMIQAHMQLSHFPIYFGSYYFLFVIFLITQDIVRD